MPLVGWTGKVVRAYLDLSDVDEQTAFWSERLNTIRFCVGFDALMSPAIYVPYTPRASCLVCHEGLALCFGSD